MIRFSVVHPVPVSGETRSWRSRTLPMTLLYVITYPCRWKWRGSSSHSIRHAALHPASATGVLLLFWCVCCCCACRSSGISWPLYSSAGYNPSRKGPPIQSNICRYARDICPRYTPEMHRREISPGDLAGRSRRDHLLGGGDVEVGLLVKIAEGLVEEDRGDRLIAMMMTIGISMCHTAAPL